MRCAALSQAWRGKAFVMANAGRFELWQAAPLRRKRQLSPTRGEPSAPEKNKPRHDGRGGWYGEALGCRFVTLGKMEPAAAKKQIGNTDEETKFCLLFVCHKSNSFQAAEVSSALWKRAAASWALSRAARRVASIMWARRVSSASSSMPGRV